MKYFILILCIFGAEITFSQKAESPVFKNFFLEEFGTFRENHTYFASHNIGVVHELREEIHTGDFFLNTTTLDHNGLPVTRKIYRVESEENWEPAGPVVEQTDYLYIMEELFLKQLVTQYRINRDYRDTIESKTRYINYFNRARRDLNDGTRLQFEYNEDNQLAEVIAIFPNHSSTTLELSYQYGRLKEVKEIFREPGRNQTTLRTAAYFFDEFNRPMEVHLLNEAEEIKVQITYNSQGHPLLYKWSMDDETFLKTHYRYESRQTGFPAMTEK